MTETWTDDELKDDEGKYRCPHCNFRLLRINNYAECSNCGSTFKRGSLSAPKSWKGSSESGDMND